MVFATFPNSHPLPTVSAPLPALPEREIAVSRGSRALFTAIAALGFLTVAGTTMIGCGSAASSTGSGGQSGSGTGGTGLGGKGGVGSGGGAGSGVGGGGTGGGGGAIGGGGSGAAGGGAGGTAGASAVIWTSDATQAVVEDDGGGFVGPPPTGSECGYGVGTYTFTVADGKLAWHYCDSNPATAGAPFTFVDGSRILTADERDMLVTTLKAVVPSTNALCGADKSQRLLTITRPSGANVYRDDFYACMHLGVYVQGIDAVFSTASTLAK